MPSNDEQGPKYKRYDELEGAGPLFDEDEQALIKEAPELKDLLEERPKELKRRLLKAIKESFKIADPIEKALVRLALYLLSRGFNVVPVNKEKEALVPHWSSGSRVAEEDVIKAPLFARKKYEKERKEGKDRGEENVGKVRGIALVAGPCNPLGPVVYLVILDIDDPRIIERCPSVKKLLETTVSWLTGPRCPKCLSKHLKVKEEGKRFYCEACDLEFSIEEAKWGRAIAFLVETEVVKKYVRGTERKGPFEIIINNYQLIPPSKHTTGVEYKWIKLLNPKDEKNNFGLITLSEGEFHELLADLEKFLSLVRQKGLKFGVEKEDAIKGLRIELKEVKEVWRASYEERVKKSVQRIVDVALEFYEKGYRDFIIFYLLGLFVKAGVSYEIAREVIDLITRTANDEERGQRLYLVDWQYGKTTKPEVDVEKFKGFSGLKEVFEAVLRARGLDETAIAKKTSQALAEIHEAVEGIKASSQPATEVSETFTYTGDRPFKGRVQIGALALPFSRYTQLRFWCDEPECEISGCLLARGLVLDMNDPARFDPSAFATYFDTNDPLSALAVYVERHPFPRCPNWRRKVSYSGRGERAVTGAIVYDLTGREGRAWFPHGPRCDLRRVPNWIIAEGWLCKGHKGRIGVLITAFTSESEVMAPPEGEVEKARAILKSLVEPDKGLEGSAVFKIAELLRRKANAKGNEVRKGFAADLLLVASPVWVKTPESADKELGATICELGPSTTYKSLRERLLISWLGAGKYLRGRTTGAGLTAGLEKVEDFGWVVKKGALPSADLSFVIVDNMPPHALDDQIESRRDGVVCVTGIKQMELWARARLKLLNNPPRPFDELVYKCVALKMFDPKLIARFTFAVYTYGVSIDERYDPSISSPTPEEEKVLEAARTILRWNLSKETVYEVPRELWPKVMELSKELELKYGCEDIPLLLRNIPYKLAVLAYSFALLEGEVEPAERHYQLAHEWLDFCARDIELDKYAEVQRELHGLSDEEYEKLRKAIEEEIEEEVKEHGGGREDSYLYRFIDYLVKHGKARCDELAAYLEVDESTVKRKARLLKGLGLLYSSKSGYALTPKGVKVIRRWLCLAPGAPNATTSGGEGPVREARP
jgi:hypothetical protein